MELNKAVEPRGARGIRGNPSKLLIFPVFPVRPVVNTLFAAALLTLAPAAYALTCTSQNVAGNWNAPATWSGCGGGVPGAADDVVIANFARTYTVNANAQCRSLTFQGGDQATTLQINGGQTLTVNGNTVINSPTANVTKRLNVRANGRLAANGDLTLAGGGGNQRAELQIDSNAGSLATVTGNLNVNNTNARVTFGGAGTLRVGGNFANGGTFTRGTGTVLYNGAGNQNVGAYTYQNLTVSKTGGTAVTTGVTTVNSVLSVTAGALNVAGFNFTVTGTTGITGTLAHTSTAGTKIFTGRVTVNPGGTWRNNTVNEDITLRGGLTNNGTFTSGTGTYTFDTNNNQQLNGTGITFARDVVANRTVVNNTTVTIGRNLSGSSTWTNNTNSTLNIAGNLTSGLTASASGNTVNYNGAAAQSARGATYWHLTIGSAGLVTLSADTNIRGNLTDNGNFRPATGNRTVTFNGTAAQGILGAAASTTFYRLTQSNAAGLTLGHNVTASNRLTFGVNNARLITGANRIIIPNGGSVNGATGASNRFVVGNLQKYVPGGANRTVVFEVGSTSTGNRYAPATLRFSSVTAAGSVMVSTTGGDHPQIGTGNSGLDPLKSVNRYWTLTNVGTNFTVVSAAFTFVNPWDIDGGANTGTFQSERWNGATWNTTIIGTRTATSTQVTGLIPSTAFGDFAVAEKTSNPGGFNAFETSTAAGALTGTIKTKIAGTPFSLDIIAYNLAKTAILTGFTQTVKVELLDSSNNTGALDANGCRATWSTIQTLPNQTFVAADLGRHRINGIAENNAWRDVRVRVTYPASGAPVAIGCSGDNFAVRPAALAVSASDNDWVSAGTGRALNNTVAAGGTIHKAGQPFTLTAAASPATATRYGGSPTLKTLACTLPVGCANGTLTLGTWSGSGTRQMNDASYSEAGTFNLELEDPNFAAVDSADSTAVERTIPQSAAPLAVGRFVPDRFAVAYNTPQFGTACGSGAFTYVGQKFNYTTAPVITVTAQNAAGNTTLNYKDALWKITSASLTGKTYAAASGSLDTGGLPATDPAIADAGNGTGTLSFGSGTGLAFSRGVPVAPFNAEISLAINVLDSEGVTYASNPAKFGDATPGNGIAFGSGKAMRFGILKLANAYGSELLALPVPAQTQYVQSIAGGVPIFATHSADSCTTLQSANIALVKNPAACTTAVAGNVSFASGVGNLSLTAPGAKCTADITVDLAAESKTWLQGRWSGASYNQNPTARASFGIYGGGGSSRNPVIYLRENY